MESSLSAARYDVSISTSGISSSENLRGTDSVFNGSSIVGSKESKSGLILSSDFSESTESGSATETGSAASSSSESFISGSSSTSGGSDTAIPFGFSYFVPAGLLRDFKTNLQHAVNVSITPSPFRALAS